MDIVFTILSLVGFIALTAGTALFVAAEFSLTALERSTVDEAARGGDRRSRQVQHAHKTLSFQLSGAQLGITITTLITGYLAEPVLARFITPVTKAVGLSESAASTTSLILALVIATSFSMIFGELVPKNLAISKPMPTARATAGLQAGFSLIFRWAINGLNGTANWIVRRLGIEPAEELRSARSPQELGSLVRTSAQRGSIDKGTAMLVDRSLQFGDRTAEELMTPRVKIESLELSDTVADLIVTASRTGYSRFPVVRGDLDDTVGVVHIKHAFTVPAERRRTTRVDSLAQRVPVAAVEPGRRHRHGANPAPTACRLRSSSTSTAELPASSRWKTSSRKSSAMCATNTTNPNSTCSASATDGRAPVSCASTRSLRLPGTPLPKATTTRSGGLVLTELGRIPDEGDEVELPDVDSSGDSRGKWIARVTGMDGRRIDRVTITPVPAYVEPESADDSKKESDDE